MHDQLQQLLSAAKMRAGLVRRQLNDPAAIEGLSALERLLEQAMAESTALIRLLKGSAPGTKRAKSAGP
jgi:signal transduction histidine kinase